MAKDIVLYQDSFGEPVSIPVLRHRARRRGPHVLLTSLIHGDEVIGAHALLSIFHELKARKDFRGTITALPCLNRSGFEQNSRMFRAEFSNGSTGSQNLNRCFGTTGRNLTNEVARTILSYVQKLQPDFLIDCHSYASNSLVHTIVDRPSGTLEKEIVDWCTTSRVPFYLEYAPKIQKEQKLDFSFSNQVCLLGIPAITVELGPLNGFSYQQGKIAVQAIKNLVAAAGSIVEEPADLFSAQQTSIPPGFTFYREPIINDSNTSGFYRPLVDAGASIKRGEIVAEIVSLRGRIVHRVRSPASGYLLVFENGGHVHPRAQFGVMIRRKA